MKGLLLKDYYLIKSVLYIILVSPSRGNGHENTRKTGMNL